jgi:hypothetical protein
MDDICAIVVAQKWMRTRMNGYEMPLIAESHDAAAEFGVEAGGRGFGVMPGPVARSPAQMRAV